MTFDEYISKYENIMDQLKNALKFNPIFELRADVFSSRISEILDETARLNSTMPQLKMMENMSTWLAHIQSNKFISALDTYDRLFSTVSPALLSGVEISYELVERISNIISNTVCYIPENIIQEEFIEAVPDASHEKRKTFLTIDRAIALLGLLITIYTAIIAQLPNPQLTEISQQNEQIIAIEEERLELERQQTELLEDIADNLRDVIIDLNEQIETQTEQFDILSNQPEDTGDLDVLENQDTKTDSQENNAEPKN